MDRLDELETRPRSEVESNPAPNGAPSSDGAERAGVGLVASRDEEEIRRIDVPDEDQLAFRVGVNLIVLAALAVGVWWLWRTLRLSGFQLFP